MKPKNIKHNKKKPPRNNFIWIMLLFGLAYMIMAPNVYKSLTKEINYGIYYQMLVNNSDSGEITSAIKEGSNITGQLLSGTEYRVHAPSDDPDLIRLLRTNVPKFEIQPPNLLTSLLWSILPMGIFILFLWLVFYRNAAGGGRGGVMSFGKSRARQVSGDKVNITFKDAAGVDEAKEELKEIIDFLKEPKKYQRLGGKIPKGVLLMGPPGTGKTLLAKAVAGEAKVPFFSISGSDFVEMFVGVGASRVRDLFEQAKRQAKLTGHGCIIFIDEIDAVGRQRFAGIGGGHDEREQTLNALLVEMDGFNTQAGVILIAATNRPDVLDPALLRTGRFDRQIVIDRPDIVGREEILKVHTRSIKLDKGVDLKKIARQTPGFSGADIANLVNEGALLAARKEKDAVTSVELEASIERVMAGPERKQRVISDYEKKIVAFHEAGHALLSLLIPEVDPLHKVSIIPRGTEALGYTLQVPIEDRYITTKKELLGRLAVLLGGRVSEEITFHEITTGAHSDLEIATNIARRMVMEFGMSDALGHLTFGHRQRQVFLGRDITENQNYSEKTAQAIDQEVKRLVESCYNRAHSVLEANKEKLELLAKALLEHEVLDVEQVKKIVGVKKSAA